MSEKPVQQRPRRLADWINPTGARKVHSLIDKVYQRKNLLIAWERVKANRGAGGIDHQSIASFAERLEKQLDRLHSELRTHTYRPQPVRLVHIPKAGKPGGYRPLGIPTVKDRIVQAATKLVIEPLFEASFLSCSYGFRPKKSQHQAHAKVQKLVIEGYRYVVEVDLKSYCNTIPHERLLACIRKRVRDPKVLRLIRHWLKVGVLDPGQYRPTEEGVPQGGPLSPLLSNA